MKPMSEEMIRQRISDEFSAIADVHYFNAAYFGPLPQASQRLGHDAIARQGDPRFYPYLNWAQAQEETRALFAGLLGVSPENVAHQTSVSEIISEVANGVRFTGPTCVVTTKGDYPSVVQPWLLMEPRRGFDLVQLDEDLFLDVELLTVQLPAATKIICVSHVMFNSGKRVDLYQLGRLCRDRGILFVVDGSQAFGGLQVSAEEIALIDVYACATYKWLLCPYGHAMGYFSDRALATIDRTRAHWLTSPNAMDSNKLLSYTTEATPGARKFDRGQVPNMIALAMVQGSLELMRDIGLPWIERHNRDLVERFLARIPKEYLVIGPRTLQSNIVCIRPPKSHAAETVEALKRRGIDVTSREGNVRLSFHLFNTPTQVDYLAQSLEELLNG